MTAKFKRIDGDGTHAHVGPAIRKPSELKPLVASQRCAGPPGESTPWIPPEESTTEESKCDEIDTETGQY